MAAKKMRPEEFQKLYLEAQNNLHEKKVVESLKKKLNDRISKDPKLQKKAALIIEDWLNKKTKR